MNENVAKGNASVEARTSRYTKRDIEQRAYGLWQKEGGRFPEEHYWFQAQSELERESVNHASGSGLSR